MKPHACAIRLIRDISKCRTASMGGHLYSCKQCHRTHFVYHGCGNSRCMICQSIKREQWVDRLRAKMLEVPYVHIVFTLPHQLNGLARMNPSVMYSTLMKVSWKLISHIGTRYHYNPGMTAVLHTFGSDLKYHVHLHALVTFGGLSAHGEWVRPQSDLRLEKYRTMSKLYREFFLKELLELYKNGKLSYHQPLNNLLNELSAIRWVVHSTRPTMHTQVIENYLARYINRIAISPSRLQYLADIQQVQISYNDYRNQLPQQVAPKLIKYLKPLDAIMQILQHCTPRYFQKSRHYGLHHALTKSRTDIPQAYLKSALGIRTVFQIIRHLLKSSSPECNNCGCSVFYKMKVAQPFPVTLLPRYLSLFNKDPPISITYRHFSSLIFSSGTATPMNIFMVFPG